MGHIFKACATLPGQREQIERLRPLIAKLCRRTLGARSETIMGQIDQLKVELEEMETIRAAAEGTAGMRESDGDPLTRTNHNFISMLET